jgi:hypothetical protein
MVTIPTGLAINTATVSDRANALSFRRILGALFKQTSAGNPVAGIMPGPNTPLDVQTSPTSMQYYVKAGYAVTARTNQGAYLVGTGGRDVPVSVGNATNPRYDRIYIVQPDPELGETGQARIDVVQGTPAGGADSFPPCRPGRWSWAASWSRGRGEHRHGHGRQQSAELRAGHLLRWRAELRQ